MRIHQFVIVVGLAAAVAVAQDVVPPPTVTRVEPKEKSLRVWTNEDLQQLRGSVNVIGSDTTSATPAARSERSTKQAQPCESDAWTVTVAAVLKLQGVVYPTNFWADRLFGGACIDHVAPASVAARIDGDYTLDDGRKLHLKTNSVAGLPAAPEIVASMDHQPLVLKWQGQPLVLTKVDYIDRQYNYVSQYSISSLMLTNVLTGRRLIFDLAANSAKEIEGSFQIAVEPR